MGMESFSSCLSWICNIFGEFQCDITYFVMYIYVDSKVSTPAGAKSRTASVVLGRNQPDWVKINCLSKRSSHVTKPAKLILSINRIYVYDKGRVVFPQHILLLFLPQTALLILNMINSYKFWHEKGRVVLKRQFYSHFSNKKTAIFIFIYL